MIRGCRGRTAQREMRSYAWSRNIRVANIGELFLELIVTLATRAMDHVLIGLDMTECDSQKRILRGVYPRGVFAEGFMSLGVTSFVPPPIYLAILGNSPSSLFASEGVAEALLDVPEDVLRLGRAEVHSLVFIDRLQYVVEVPAVLRAIEVV